ncbi:sodium-independent anion transporter [Clostridiaceae bacterium 14S0207]|nr:sodium-independent anion transporter [Clostridiaceae bacterium 14S0207]
MSMPKLLDILKNKRSEFSKEQIMQDIIAGIIVAIIALPLSVALGISSGVSPDKGLITAIIAGVIISLLGGSRVQIGGPTGAFVVIIFGIIQNYGIEGLIIATIMAGIILVIFGLCKFGSLIKYISYPITVGFTSGIAVTLFSTQVKDFLGLTINKVPSEFIPKWSSYISNINTINFATLALGILSLGIIIIWPKINKKIPGSLVTLIITTLIAYFFKLPVATIGSQFGEISSNISMPKIPIIDIKTITMLIKPAFTIAILAGIESLLSAVVSDGMISDKHDSNMELIAQGVANIFSGLFGGIPATGAIARTAANVKNGGKTPLAGIVHAITLLLIMKLFMPFAKYIPLTTLASILIVVSYNMSGWRTFKEMLKAPKSDIITLIVTFTLTVVFDLVVAIEIGMIISMFLFMRKMAISLQINELNGESCNNEHSINNIETKEVEDKILVYEIKGALFFGVAEKLMDSIRKMEKTTEVVILRMSHIPVMDITAYSTINKIESLCKKQNIALILSEVQEQPMKVMNKMEYKKNIGHKKLVEGFKDAIKIAKQELKKQENII